MTELMTSSAAPANGIALVTFNGFEQGDVSQAFDHLDDAVAAFIVCDPFKIPRVKRGSMTLLEFDPEEGQVLTWDAEAARVHRTLTGHAR